MEKLNVSTGSFSFLPYIETWAWYLRKSLSEYWRLFSQENCNIVKVFSVPASKHTKHQGLQQARKWMVKKPFCIQRAQKTLFSTISMMITVLKDTALQYFKHRNSHWWDGQTWILFGKFFFLFLWNTFTWRLFAIICFHWCPNSLSGYKNLNCISLL